MRLKKVIPFFVLTFLLSCSGDPKLSENPNTTFKDFRMFLLKNFSGLTLDSINEINENDIEMLGASAGAGFSNGDDLNIEAYLFDEKKKVKKAENTLAETLKAFDLDPPECLVSGYFLICNADEGDFKSKGLLSKF